MHKSNDVRCITVCGSKMCMVVITQQSCDILPQKASFMTNNLRFFLTPRKSIVMKYRVLGKHSMIPNSCTLWM